VKTVNTFYSWQWDISHDTNLKAIRSAIRKASDKLENDIASLNINNDESTRKKAGSPHIPNTIFEKIASSDIFIADITTINKECPIESIRRTPNPNVLIELGYAIAHLGWERIILVFNKSFGNFPADVPFDIDKRRILDYTVSSKDDSSGKGQLTVEIKDAIKTILEIGPPSAMSRTKSSNDIKRERDIEQLTSILETINIPILEQYIDALPERIMDNIFYFKDHFVELVESLSFNIYDSELNEIIIAFKNAWVNTLSFDKYFFYEKNSNNYKFELIADSFPTSLHERSFKNLTSARNKLQSESQKLFNYININYLEIDITKTSDTALSNYVRNDNYQ